MADRHLWTDPSGSSEGYFWGHSVPAHRACRSLTPLPTTALTSSYGLFLLIGLTFSTLHSCFPYHLSSYLHPNLLKLCFQGNPKEDSGHMCPQYKGSERTTRERGNHCFQAWLHVALGSSKCQRQRPVQGQKSRDQEPGRLWKLQVKLRCQDQASRGAKDENTWEQTLLWSGRAVQVVLGWPHPMANFAPGLRVLQTLHGRL